MPVEEAAVPRATMPSVGGPGEVVKEKEEVKAAAPTPEPVMKEQAATKKAAQVVSAGEATSAATAPPVVPPPSARPDMRERSVPSTPLARVLGFGK